MKYRERKRDMDGRGGCCITRYTGGAYDISQVDRIMLRFRPIAPKPATGGSVSGSSTPENREVYVRTGRGKRRYVRDNNCNNKRANNRKTKASPDAKIASGGPASGGEEVVTLPLLPETPDRKESPARGSSSDLSDVVVTKKHVKNVPIWLSFDHSHGVKDNQGPSALGHVDFGPDRTAMMKMMMRQQQQPVRVVGSCVTVECVTETWADGNGLGCTNEERVLNLERDTCPGIISDGLNRVCWTNKAYREMVGQGEGEMTVWLVTKEWVSLPVTQPAFTCRVRVTCGKEMNSLTTLPCDVWRMDGGGFAWRLDLKAALCLGRR